MARLPDKYDVVQNTTFRINGMLRSSALYSVPVGGFQEVLAPVSILDPVSNMSLPAGGQLRNDSSSTWVAQVNFIACLDFSLNAGSFLIFTIFVNGVATNVYSYVVSNNVTAGNNTALSGQITIPPNGVVQVYALNSGAGLPITMNFYNFFLSVTGIRVV